MAIKIIKYIGIVLIVVGIGVLSFHFINNYFIANRESEILSNWEPDLGTENKDQSVMLDEDKISSSDNDEGNNLEEDIVKIIDPGQKLPFKIIIPKIDVAWVVNEGTDSATLKKGPGFFLTSAFPGENGTTVVCGHRTTYGAPFNRLNELKTGDQIILETKGNEIFTYLVTEQIAVIPTDMSVLEDTEYPSLVLSTCTPKYYSTKRLIIFARIQE